MNILKEKINLKQQRKGISLIVLVITIIVIIVLATAVILSIANNNPIENAKKAVFLNDMKEIEDEVNMYALNKYADKYLENLEEETSVNVSGDEMVSLFPSTKKYKEKIQIIDGKVVLTDKATEKEKEWASEINISGLVAWDGVTKDTAWYDNNKNGTEFEIYTAAELAGLAKLVNERRENFEGKTINLMNDIDLGGNEWEPIGDYWKYYDGDDYIAFSGVFCGNEHKVSNMKIEDDLNDSLRGGLFGFCFEGTIKDITVCDSTLSGMYVASVACCVDGGKIENCHSLRNTITANCNAAGIVCDNVAGGQVINCSNASVIKCTSNIYQFDYGAGGIVGAGIDGDGTYVDTSKARISNCYNSGKIISETNAGGITSRLFDCVIENCYNVGEVSANGLASGIIADFWDNDVINCYNIGNISGEENNTGEIIGSAGCEGTVVNCYCLQNKIAIGSVNGPDDPNWVEGDPYLEDEYIDIQYKTISEMKELSFVTSLNNGSTNFKQDTNNINDGYPILSWQK